MPASSTPERVPNAWPAPNNGTSDPRSAVAQHVALNQVLRFAVASNSLQELAKESCRILTSALGCDYAGIWRPSTQIDGAEVTPLEAAISYAVRSGEPVVCPDTELERRFDATFLVRSGFRSGIVVRITHSEHALGVLSVLNHTPRSFSQDDIALARDVANIIALGAARLEAEAKERNVRSVYRSLMDLAQEGAMTIDLASCITYVNPRMAAIVGKPSDELLGRAIWEIFPPEDRNGLEQWLRSGNTGEPRKIEARLVRPDGSTVWVSIITASPLLRRDGSVAGKLVLITDVTDRVASEEALRRREAQLSDAQAIAHLGSWDLDPESGILRCSDEMLRILGLEGVGCDLTLDAAAAAAPQVVEALREAVKRNDPLDLGHEVVTPDGMRHHVRSRAHPLTDRDGHARYVGTLQDVTDEVLATREQEGLRDRVASAAFAWRTTFDSIPSPIVLVDEDLRVLRLNAAALGLSQFDGYQSALGAKLGDLGGCGPWHELEAVAAAVRDQDVVSVRTRDDQGRHWDVTARAWSDTGTHHVTVFATDVTSIARMEETLRRNERMSAVGSLIAGVAHEVRNPLFAISATLDAIDVTRNAGIPSRLTSALRGQVNRMNELMQDLLEYGKPKEAELREDDLAVLLAMARTSIRALAENGNVGIEIATAPDLPRIRMDRRRLMQVFENLLRNAVQHSPAGSTVEVRAQTEKESVVVTVADRGSGFCPEDLPHVFEPFFTRRKSGTGLGLSLAQRIVTDHGGEIAALQRDGGGAVMLVRLPASVGGSQ